MYFYIYRDAKNEWRWRLQAANHKTIADSGEGYHNREDCIGAIRLIKDGAGTAGVFDVSVSPALTSDFLEAIYNRILMRTAPIAAVAPPRHRAFPAAAPAAGAPRDAHS